MATVKAVRPLDPNALSASPEEAARFLSVHRRTVDRLIADRILKAHKAGRRVLVDMASIRAYSRIAASDRGRAMKDIEGPMVHSGVAAVNSAAGRAPAPPAIEAGRGRQRQGARHVSESQQQRD